MQHPRVYAFLHLPIQSASDPILGAMRREYTRSDFCHVVDYLRDKVVSFDFDSSKPTNAALCAQVPGVTIATDIICGFPGRQ